MGEAGRPWEVDRLLSVEQAREAIAAQFPDIDVEELTPLGSGWEFDVYATTDGWVFRFPRRSQYATLFGREERVLSLVSPVLEGLVGLPKVELHGGPGDFFPYAFAGHRLVPGVPADLSRGSPPPWAEDIGRVLSRLHALPERAGRAAGLEIDADGCAEWLTEAKSVAEDLPGSAPVVDAAVAWLDEVTDIPPAYEGPLRVIHNDLKPEHLLVDAESSGLVGVIDWTDTGLGDPALDFVAFAPLGGATLLDGVLRGYEHPVDPTFRNRVIFLSRVLSLCWLHESLERGHDLAKPIEWVGRALGAPP